MSHFNDPSIISLVTNESSTQVPNPEISTETPAQDNAITKFLREAENKREKEESTSESTLAEPTEQKQLFDHSQLHIEVEDFDFEFKNSAIQRYQPSELLRIRRDCTIVIPEGLPSKSYYRFKQAQSYSSNGNSNHKGYNSRNYMDGTGAMGNFNLGRRHDRNSNSRHGNSRRNRNNRKQDEDSWLAEYEKDGPAGTAEDFEKWKARINNEERKKRGENIKVEQDEPKNTIDNFFSLAKPLNKGTSNQSSQDVNKNSKFLTFFKPTGPESAASLPSQSNEQSNSDGVSKILSFLGPGSEKEAPEEQQRPPLSQQSSLQSSPQTGSQFSQPSSQFNFNQNTSPSVSQDNSSYPPGLGPQNSENDGTTPKVGGDSFFMSLMNKDQSKSEAKDQSKPKPRDQQQQQASQQHTPQHQIAPQQPQQYQQAQQPKNDGQGPPQHPQIHPQHQEQQRPQFPPGFQGPPPGFAQRGQFPPGFNPNGPVPPPPPGFNPQQLPPWLSNQQLPPHLQQFQGRIIPGQFPPVPGNLPPPHLRGPPGQQGQGQGPPPPQFFAQGAPDQQRFPPGFFNAPPPGFAPQPQTQQQTQQQQK